MIILGVILIIGGVFAGWFTAPPGVDMFSVDPWSTTIPLLWAIGILLVVTGVSLEVLGRRGDALGGRRHYF